MDQTLAITLWVMSGAAIGGIATPLIVQRKPLNNWAAMATGIVVGMVGNLIALMPMWLLLYRGLPDSPGQLAWQSDTAGLADVEAASSRPNLPDLSGLRARAAQWMAQPSPYMVVFLILALFTVMEAGISYLPDLPEGVRIGVLGFLAATKASLVLLYFMHLKSDYRIFTLPFTLGLVLVIPLILIVGLTTGEASPPPSGNGPPPAAGVGESGQVGQDELISDGKQLFEDNCAMCHASQSDVGPPFEGMASRAASRVSGQTAQQYIHQSIVNPSAFVVPGYSNMMPENFGQTLDAEQIDALVDYIMAESGSG